MFEMSENGKENVWDEKKWVAKIFSLIGMSIENWSE